MFIKLPFRKNTRYRLVSFQHPYTIEFTESARSILKLSIIEKGRTTKQIKLSRKAFKKNYLRGQWQVIALDEEALWQEIYN